MSALGVSLAVRLLSDQEVFHQKLLKELLEQTSLARALGLWKAEQPPQVKYEPDGGLFDLKLCRRGADEEVGIELKVNSFLGEEQEDRQRKFAVKHQVRRAYVLLGPTYYCWRAKMPRVDDRAIVISPASLHSALTTLLPDIKDEALSSLVVGYLPYLEERVQSSQRAYLQTPDATWLGQDWNVFRFLDELGAHWPTKSEVYQMPHGGGYDRILNPRSPGGSDRRVLSTPTWARVFWEIVAERVRFKVHVPAKQHREAVRSLCRKALHAAAKRTDQRLIELGRLGEHMTIAQLDLDIFGSVLDAGGRMVPEQARALYERCEHLLDEMLADLRAPASPPSAHPAAS
jgi:hypothetical protein